MTEISPNLLLPYIMPSQAQKHVTHNEAVRALDALTQIAVFDRDRMAPPSDRLLATDTSCRQARRRLGRTRPASSRRGRMALGPFIRRAKAGSPG